MWPSDEEEHTINDCDHASFDESLFVNGDRPIADGGSRCDFIT